MISITRSVSFVVNTSIWPVVPDGTIAAFAVTWPVIAFKVETTGLAEPVGQVVIYPRVPRGTAVKFSE